MKSRWSISALGAFFVAVALLVAGCGTSGVPAGAVATVAGNPISKRAVDHFMYTVVKQQSAQSPNAPIIVPNDPPDFATCIREAKSGYPQLKKESDAAVRKICKGVFTQLTNDVLGFFIQGYWYQAYAHKLGINVTNAQVAKELMTLRGAQLKSQSAYTAFLKSSGYTNADLLWRARIQLLSEKLQNRFETKVTKADIAAYYRSHASAFGTPETRNMRIVLAKNLATAKTAMAALKHGQSWATVAKKYSTDPTTKNNGGLLEDVSKGQQDAALSSAAFAAPLNKLVGPVKGSFGYYVVQVIKITPATHESLAKATPQIKATLTQQNSQNASNALTSKAKALYGARTLCARYYVIQQCHGYKKPKATATSSGTATGTGSSGATPSSSTTTSSSSK